MEGIIRITGHTPDFHYRHIYTTNPYRGKNGVSPVLLTGVNGIKRTL